MSSSFICLMRLTSNFAHSLSSSSSSTITAAGVGIGIGMTGDFTTGSLNDLAMSSITFVRLSSTSLLYLSVSDVSLFLDLDFVFFFFCLDVFSGIRLTSGVFLGVKVRRPIFDWVSRLASSSESVKIFAYLSASHAFEGFFLSLFASLPTRTML